jgi:hypothetical protein
MVRRNKRIGNGFETERRHAQERCVDAVVRRLCGSEGGQRYNYPR